MKWAPVQFLAQRRFSNVADQVVAWLEVGVETGRKSLAEIKSDLAQELRKVSVPLLVVMDDIDRLTPSELQQVFQLVKANGDLPNLVYLLLCERSVIERHIEEAMKVSGRDYLEVSRPTATWTRFCVAPARCYFWHAFFSLGRTRSNSPPETIHGSGYSHAVTDTSDRLIARDNARTRRL